MEKIKLLTCLLLSMLLLLSLGASFAFAAGNQTFTLSEATNQLTYTMPQGTVFNGTVATTGMVRVWVSAPDGFEVANLGIIDATTALNFVAPQNGTYTVNFENDLPNSIQVTFSYLSNPAIHDDNSSTNMSIIYTIITVVAAVVGSAVIILLLQRQKKTQGQVSKKATSKLPAQDP